jgi:hypothetical protein
MHRWVSFRRPLRSKIEFWHHLLVVLWIHTLSARTCIGRIAGRCCRNSILDRSGARKLTSSMHPRVGLGPILHLLDSRNTLWIYLLVLLLVYICMCQRMDNREWMYTGHTSMSSECITKTNPFLEHAFGEAAKGLSRMPCPCSRCGNKKRKTRKNVGEDLCKYGFTANYTC